MVHLINKDANFHQLDLEHSIDVMAISGPSTGADRFCPHTLNATPRDEFGQLNARTGFVTVDQDEHIAVGEAMNGVAVNDQNMVFEVRYLQSSGRSSADIEVRGRAIARSTTGGFLRPVVGRSNAAAVSVLLTPDANVCPDPFSLYGETEVYDDGTLYYHQCDVCAHVLIGPFQGETQETKPIFFGFQWINESSTNGANVFMRASMTIFRELVGTQHFETG